MRIGLFFVLCLALFSLTRCVAPSLQTPGVTSPELARESETQQALANNSQLARTGNIRRTAEHQQRVAAVSRAVRKGAATLCDTWGVSSPCSFNVELAKDGSLNAYADGRKVVITPAMVEFTESNAELAVILGHEYAHNLLGHVAAQQTNTAAGAGAGMLLDLVAGAYFGVDTQSMFARSGQYLGQVSYSKAFEQEADYVGLYLVALAGYPIDNAPLIWRKMTVYDAKGVYTNTTHPTNPARYLALEKTVAEIKQKQRKGLPLVPERKANAR